MTTKAKLTLLSGRGPVIPQRARDPSRGPVSPDGRSCSTQINKAARARSIRETARVQSRDAVNSDCSCSVEGCC